MRQPGMKLEARAWGTVRLRNRSTGDVIRQSGSVEPNIRIERGRARAAAARAGFPPGHFDVRRQVPTIRTINGRKQNQTHRR